MSDIHAFSSPDTKENVSPVSNVSQKQEKPATLKKGYRTVSSRYMSQNKTKPASTSNTSVVVPQKIGHTSALPSRSANPLNGNTKRTGTSSKYLHDVSAQGTAINYKKELKSSQSHESVAATPFRKPFDDDLVNTPCPVPSMAPPRPSASMSLVTPTTTNLRKIDHLSSSRSLKPSPDNQSRIKRTNGSSLTTRTSPPSSSSAARTQSLKPQSTISPQIRTKKPSNSLNLTQSTRPPPPSVAITPNTTSAPPKKAGSSVTSKLHGSVNDPLVLKNLRMQYRIIYSILYPRFKLEKAELQREILELSNQVLVQRKRIHDMKMARQASSAQEELITAQKHNEQWKNSLASSLPRCIGEIHLLTSVARSLNGRLYLKEVHSGGDVEYSIKAFTNLLQAKLLALSGDQKNIFEVHDDMSAQTERIQQRLAALENRIVTLRQKTEDAVMELSSRIFKQTMHEPMI